MASRRSHLVKLNPNLGTGWSASLAVSGIVFGALLVMVIMAGASNGTVVAASVAAPTLVVLSSTVMAGRSWVGAAVVMLPAAALAAAASAAFSADVVASFNAGAAGWILLPAIAVLFRPRDSVESADQPAPREGR